MAVPVKPDLVKFFIGILFQDEIIMKKALAILNKKFGPFDVTSNYIPFTNSQYYEDIGNKLCKVFVSTEKLIEREKIVNIKLYTNWVEQKVSGNKKKRKINIDPGFMTLSNVFLASCKEFYDRAYLSKGVFIENEYMFKSKEYHFWEWTYPDYRKKEYLDFFYSIRKIYQNQLKKTK